MLKEERKEKNDLITTLEIKADHHASVVKECTLLEEKVKEMEASKTHKTNTYLRGKMQSLEKRSIVS